MEASFVDMPTEEVKIGVPWGFIAGKVLGSLSAPPILCVHGIQDNANTFDHLIPLLPSHFCYVAIDLPGHGRSSHFPAGGVYTLVDYCMSLCRVVEHFGWKRFIFMGHSLGGQLGYLYSAINPEQVLKLVVLDAVIGFRLPEQHIGDLFSEAYQKLFKLEKNMTLKSPPSYTEEEAVRRLSEGRPTPLTREAALVLFSRGVIKNGDGFAFSADQRLKLKVHSFFSKQEKLSLYRRIQCPIFVVRASETEAFNNYYGNQAFSKLFTSRLGSNYHFKVVEGTHDVHLLHPELFATDLCNFLLETQSSL